MNISPKVDVLIIAYNQEQYIEDAIMSVVNQSYGNTHVIVADDASTDKTTEIVKKLTLIYPGKITHIINKINKGITLNCNSGLEHCTGDFLVLMGGDDILYENKIAMQIDFFLANPAYTLLGHSLDLIDVNSCFIGKMKEPSRNKQGEGPSEFISKGMLFGCLAIMVNRKNCKEIKFDSRIGISSDLKYFIDCLKSNGKYGYIKKELGAYRISKNSITNSKWQLCLEDATLTLNILEKELPFFHNSVRKGRAYLLYYGSGLKYLRDNQTFRALQYFLKALKYDPFFLKNYYRIIETISKMILRNIKFLKKC